MELQRNEGVNFYKVYLSGVMIPIGDIRADSFENAVAKMATLWFSSSDITIVNMMTNESYSFQINKNL